MGKNEEKLKGSEKFAAPPHLSDSSPLKPAGIGAAACKNHVGVESARFASRSGRRKGADLLRPCSAWALFNRKPNTEPNRTETEPNSRFFGFSVRCRFPILRSSVFGFGFGFSSKPSRTSEEPKLNQE